MFVKESVHVEINEPYIELIGDTMINNTSDAKWDETEGYIQRMREQVFNTKVVDEFNYGWRSRFDLEVTVDEAAEFTGCCVGLVGDKIEIDDFRRLVQPIQIPMAKRYREEHIQSLRDAPLEYRQRQAEYLTPLFQACSDALTVNDILSLLLDGVIQSISPLGRHSDPDTIVSGLEDKIVDNEDEIDLSHGYFYQGPRHLGVLPTGKDNKVASCVCEYKGGYIYPFLFSDKDPVNKEAMKILEYID